jgi:hypothetical protein
MIKLGIYRYSRTVARIYENPNEYERKAAQRLLGLLCCSKRPLKWHEIQGLFSIDVDDGSVDFDSRMLRIDISDLCGSLVKVEPGDSVEFVHATARS